MSRSARHRRKRMQVIVSVASLGDIAFLLIIFFMICSNFMKDPGNLKPAASADVVALQKRPLVVSIDAENQIRVQRQLVRTPEEVEWAVRSLVGDKTTDEGRTVMFKCDRTVRKDVFEPVLDAIAQGGGLIAVVGDKQKTGS